MKVQDSISFKARYKIDFVNYDYIKGLQKAAILKSALLSVGEKNILIEPDISLKKILVTTSQDTDNFTKELAEIKAKDIHFVKRSILKIELMHKYLDYAIEFGEKQIELLKNTMKKELNI